MALPVNAGLLISLPGHVCGLLSEEGLVTRGWKNYYDLTYGCSSEYKEIGTKAPLANNLSFYVEGSLNVAKQVKLVLNINNISSASAARRELVKTANVLCISTTGEGLPPLIRDAINQGHNASKHVGPAILEVIREDWPEGKGYEIKVIIE